MDKSDIANDAATIATQTGTRSPNLDQENINHNVETVEIDRKTPRNFSNLKVSISIFILVD